MKPGRHQKAQVDAANQSRLLARRRDDVTKARRAIERNHFAQALRLLDPLRKTFRRDAEIAGLMAIALSGMHRLHDASRWAEKSLQIQPSPMALMVLARIERQQGSTDQAVAYYDRALALAPNAMQALVGKAGALEEAGRLDEARAIVGPLRAQAEATKQPIAGLDFEWAKLLVQGKSYDDAIAIIDAMLTQDDMPRPGRIAALYLKAKACDRKKDFRAAYEAAREANELGKVPYDPDLHTSQVEELIENWSREAMAKFPRSKCDSELAVFVAGMPRSGTSLIDQIIDAHPLAAGVGELSDIESFAMELSRAYDPEKPPPACFGRYQEKSFTAAAERYINHIRKLSPPGVSRVVNKALGNNKLVGLLALLFPKTRIIHAVRDPRDVAISCFMGGFNNHISAWTTQLDWSLHSWNLSQRMMEHWKQSLDVPILDVHYEALVADPEHEFPRLIEFLGLPWDERCLAFHKSRRTVRTLSYDQVNRPLYTSSAGRHTHYAEFLEGTHRHERR